MTIQNARVDMEVVRSKGDGMVGRKGKILDVDLFFFRVRVAWYGYYRTWVSVDAVEPASIPYEIVPSPPDNPRKPFNRLKGTAYPTYRRL